MIDIPTGDPEMSAAMTKARATLGDFLALAAAPKSGESGFMVKVGFRGPQGRNELFWVTPFTVDGSRLAGTLANAPVYATQLRKGQTVSFGRDEVVDWGYWEGSVMHGNFTTCVILARSTAADREKTREHLGLDCDR